MATIEERRTPGGAVTHRVKVRLRGYPEQTSTFERKTDAKRWAQQTEAAIREGRHFKTAEARRHTLTELLGRYRRDDLAKHPKKLRDQSQHATWWEEQLGARLLSDITPALIAEYRDKLANGITKRGTMRAPATVSRYLASLSRALTLAVQEWGWLDDSPMRKVSKPKEPRGRVRFLSDEEREQLLRACREHSDTLYAIVVLALSTGARRTEILSLRWSQVDPNRGVILLEETKNGERRVLPLAGHALDLMRERAKLRRINTDLVFPSRSTPPKPLAIQNIFERALKRAAIEDFRFHDLRHSAASYLAMNGASLAEIAEVLGHKTFQMVKRYAHLSEAHTARVVASMNARIFG